MKTAAIFFFAVVLISGVAPTFSQQSSSSVDSNVVAFWHFGEGVGSTARDASPYHNDGALHSTSWVDGKYGHALHFNGSSSYADLPNSNSLKLHDEFTVEAIFSLDSLIIPYGGAYGPPYPTLLGNLGYYPSGGGYQFTFAVSPLRIQFQYRSLVGSSSMPGIPITEAHRFYHVAAVYKKLGASISVRVYLDGVARDSAIFSSPIQYNQTPIFYIGTNVDGSAKGDPFPREFPGVVDEIRISRVAKSAAEIRAAWLAVSLDDLNFGDVIVGQLRQETFDISNVSYFDTLHIDSITGTNGRFSFSDAAFELAPQSTQAFQVTYTPSSASPDTGRVTIYSSNSAGDMATTVALSGQGIAVAESPVISSITDIPQDQGRQVRVIWSASLYDSPSESLRVTEYGIWRRVDQPPPSVVTARKSVSHTVFTHEGHTYAYVESVLWDFIATIPAVQFEQYSYVAPTLYNSTQLAEYWSVFRASAHTADGQFFFSAPDSGSSSDDIPPSPPPSLHVQVAYGRVMLSWPDVDDPDLKGYAIYRSTSPFSIPLSSQRIGTSPITSYTDEGGSNLSTYYYGVTAIDGSDNESPQAVSSPAILVVAVNDQDALPQEYHLAQNYPNPFNPSTSIRYALPERSRVRLSVFNTLGQKVATVIEEVQEAGYYQAKWLGDDASGMFFYKLEATSFDDPSNSFVSIRKMVLLR